MTILVRSLSLLLTPVLFAASTGELSFTPVEESEIKVQFKQVFSVELTDMTQTVDGEEVDLSEMGMPEFRLTDQEDLVFTDSFVKVGDGRAQLVHRTYDELTKLSTQEVSMPEGEEHTEEDPGASELEGLTVAFAWDAEEEEYVASYVEEDGDEDLLEDLAFQGYLLGLLPVGETAEGDRWEVEAAMFNAITEPCGDVSFVLESKQGEEDDDSWGDQFGENLDGEFFVENGGTRDEDGTTVAVLILSAEVTTHIEQTKDVDEEMFSGTVSSTFSFSFEMEGELLWDVAADRPFALTFNGEVLFEIEEDTELSGDHGEFKGGTVQMFEGTVEVSSSYN